MHFLLQSLVFIFKLLLFCYLCFFLGGQPWQSSGLGIKDVPEAVVVCHMLVPSDYYYFMLLSASVQRLQSNTNRPWVLECLAYFSRATEMLRVPICRCQEGLWKHSIACQSEHFCGIHNPYSWASSTFHRPPLIGHRIFIYFFGILSHQLDRC